ncbi:MAG: hypothetical protein RL329_856, partial [Bacteroidota bacterium]
MGRIFLGFILIKMNPKKILPI